MIIDIKCRSKSPFLPEYTILLHKSTLSADMTSSLKEMALKEEARLYSETECPENSEPDMLTARLWQYNMFDFDYPEIQSLKEHVAFQYEDYVRSLGFPVEKCYIHGWVNVLHKGQRISNHHHADAHIGAPTDTAYVSGNICIQAEKTKTYYTNPFNPQASAGVPNMPGDMFLFPSFVMHRTDYNDSEEPRISLAFDIIVKNIYDLLRPRIFIPLN